MHGPGPDSGEDDPIAAINIIPLVDVVLVLLIIFMVTTVFARDSALKLDLPKGSRPDQVKQQPVEVTVSVDRNSTIFVNGKPTKLQNLGKAISAYNNASRKTIIVLRGDKKVLYGTIMPVLDEISRTGIQVTLALMPGPPN